MSDSGFVIPPDIPRMTGQNYIMLDVSDTSGPALLSHPEFYCHTTIDSVVEEVYSGSSYGVVIKAYVTDGIVSFNTEATAGYKPTDGVHTDSCTISLTSKGSDGSWNPGTGTHNIIVVLNGTGTSLPMPLNKHIEQEEVSAFKTHLLYRDWSAVSPLTPADKFATKTLYYNNTKEPYFTLTDTEDSDSLWDDYLFEGIPKSPESLVAVAYHKEKGLSVIPVVITDNRKYTAQENAICVVQRNNDSQAKMYPENARLIDINIDSSDSAVWFDKNIGNGDILVLPHTPSNYRYRCTQTVGSPPVYTTCPYKDTSTGECTSRYGCTYNYNNNVTITKSNWYIRFNNKPVSNASGITHNDKNPPCYGWTSGAVVNCDPSFLFSDDEGTSMYEYKGSLELTHFYKDENGMCAEYTSDHAYYQKRYRYSKKFHNWPTYGDLGYGQINKPEASADIITKNESDVYNVGFTMAPLNPNMDVSDDVNKTIGVGLMCVPPSHNHLDMAIAVGNNSGYKGCASTIGGDYCLPLDYGGYTNGAYLQSYSPLTRYMTPFESTPLKGTASVSIKTASLSPSKKRLCMSYFYRLKGNQGGSLIVRNAYGSSYVYCIGIPAGRGSINLARSYYNIEADIAVDVDTDSSTSDAYNIPINLYKSSAKNDPNAYPDCMFGYDTGIAPSGGVIYHINTYKIEKNTQNLPAYYIDTNEKCIEGGGGGSSGKIRIPLVTDTQIEVVMDCDITETNWYHASCTITGTGTLKFNGSSSFREGSSTINVSGSYNKYPDAGSLGGHYMYGDINSTRYYFDAGIHTVLTFIDYDAGFMLDIIAEFTYSIYTDANGKDYIELNPQSTNIQVYHTTGQVFDITGTCTISLVNSGGSSKCCVYDIKYDGTAPTYIKRTFNISQNNYTIQKFKSSDTLYMSAVYPFEGPDIRAGKYRSIMSAHSTAILGGGTTYEEPVSSIQLKKGSQTVDMSVGSYTAIVGNSDVEDALYISDKPISVPIAHDNNYKFSLSYDSNDSSSSSGSSDSTTWYPDKAFVALHEITEISQTKTIEKGSTTIPVLDNEDIDGYLDFKAHVLDFSTVYDGRNDTNGTSMEKAVANVNKNVGAMYIKYSTLIFKEDFPLTDTFEVPAIQTVRITVAEALKKVATLTSSYKSSYGSEVGSGVSSCPDYRSSGICTTSLCTYMATPPTTEVGVDGWTTALKSWANNGIPDHFYTQLDSSLNYNTSNGPMSDILSASLPNSDYYYNSKFVVTMYRGGGK